MKIKLTESQLSRIVEDNLHPKEERFLDKFFDRVENLYTKDALQVYFREFGFDERMFKHSKRIRDWFENTILPGLRGGWINNVDKRLESILETFIEEEIEEIVGSDKNSLEKYNSLNKLRKSLEDRFGVRGVESKILNEIMGGMVDDVVSYLFDKYEPREAIRIASNIKKSMNYNDVENLTRTVKDFAEKNGIALFEKMRGGYTFKRKDDTMIRDLVNYMNDTPKKTKRGFLNYIGSQDSPGQFSQFWSAANVAGIIQKIGGGSNVTYKLGPNYNAFEEGNLVAF
jgi:hypothetical protein